MHTRNSHGGLPSTGHEMASCAHADLPAVPPPLTKVVGAVLYLGACHRGSGQVTRRPRVNVPATAGWCRRAARVGPGRAAAGRGRPETAACPLAAARPLGCGHGAGVLA